MILQIDEKAAKNEYIRVGYIALSNIHLEFR